MALGGPKGTRFPTSPLTAWPPQRLVVRVVEGNLVKMGHGQQCHQRRLHPYLVAIKGMKMLRMQVAVAMEDLKLGATLFVVYVDNVLRHRQSIQQ